MQLGPHNRAATKEAFTAATHYRDIGVGAAMTQSVHLLGDGTFVGTIRFYTSNFDDVATDSVVGGEWIDESATIADVTVNGATLGQLVHIGNIGSRRMRIRITCAAPGRLAIGIHGRA